MEWIDVLEQRVLSALALATRHRLPAAWHALAPLGDERAAASVLVRLAGREWPDLPALRGEVRSLANRVDARREEAGREGEPVWRDLARALEQLEPPPSSTFFQLELWNFLPKEGRKNLAKKLRALAPRGVEVPVRAGFLRDVARTLMTARARSWADTVREQVARGVAS